MPSQGLCIAAGASHNHLDQRDKRSERANYRPRNSPRDWKEVFGQPEGHPGGVS